MFVKTCKKMAEYVGKTWFRNHGGDMQILVKTLEMPTLVVPPAAIDESVATSTEKAIWKKKIEIYVQREMALEGNNRGSICPGDGEMHQNDASQA
jgi:hypothetical protein